MALSMLRRSRGNPKRIESSPDQTGLFSTFSSSRSVKSHNASQSLASFSPAVATFYGDPHGAGSTGGACGYEDAVEKPPFLSRVSAGNEASFKQGKGCGSCYLSSLISAAVPAAVNGDPVHFDPSGTALGALAKRCQADQLRSAGRINILYQRIISASFLC
nr:expansin-B12-like [Coffea arabica]